MLHQEVKRHLCNMVFIIFIYQISSAIITQMYVFNLDIWTKNATQALLEKIVGTPSLDKVRVIQLLDADLNMVYV